MRSPEVSGSECEGGFYPLFYGSIPALNSLPLISPQSHPTLHPWGAAHSTYRHRQVTFSLDDGTTQLPAHTHLPHLLTPCGERVSLSLLDGFVLNVTCPR